MRGLVGSVPCSIWAPCLWYEPPDGGKLLSKFHFHKQGQGDLGGHNPQPQMHQSDISSQWGMWGPSYTHPSIPRAMSIPPVHCHSNQWHSVQRRNVLCYFRRYFQQQSIDIHRLRFFYKCVSLLSMLWRCWLGDMKGIRPVKNCTSNSPKIQ